MISSTLDFRPAYPDEQGRASHLDSGSSWAMGESRWFVAVIDGPPERIVGVIRYFHDPDGTLDFRLIPGSGAELSGHEARFLDAFVRFSEAFSPGLLRYAELLVEGHPLGDILHRAGFEIRYREQYLEAPWAIAAERVGRIALAPGLRNPRWAGLEIRPARACAVETFIPLVIAKQLFPEQELRAIWDSPDPMRLDRDASACLILDGEILGVVLCADAGDHLRIMVIAGREDVPGARHRVVPLLMDHVFRTRSNHGYVKIVFRANSDQARQTVNLARRTGGRVTGEARRWGRPLLDARPMG